MLLIITLNVEPVLNGISSETKYLLNPSQSNSSFEYGLENLFENVKNSLIPVTDTPLTAFVGVIVGVGLGPGNG